MTVDSINGIRNYGFAGEMQKEDPEFRKAVQIIRKAQSSGQTSLRIIPGSDKTQPDVLMTIQNEDIPSDLAEELAQLRKMLRLDPRVKEFKIVFGMLPQGKSEIAMRTRNIRRLMNFLSLNVQVPESHLVNGIAPYIPYPQLSGQPQLTVHSGCQKPNGSFTAVQYLGYWFWIDQNDFNSKRTMNYLKVLLALADTGTKETAPTLTIRAN